MAPHLEVRVGPDRFHLELCRVNDTTRPHDIETEHFVGRVLVRILDAPGAREGEPGRRYFDGRSRKFAIQIEGRFRQPWRGSDIIFGTDFDQWLDFPRAPFNAGMRVARMIDPSTYYDEHPASGRPYIMSPYCACMNTICAWPAPYRAHDAVVVLRHADMPTRSHTPASAAITSAAAPAALAAGGTMSKIDESSYDDPTDVVPLETIDDTPEAQAKFQEERAAQKKKSLFGRMLTSGPKESRKSVKYWRFIGFKQDPHVRAFLEAHNAAGSISHHRSPTPNRAAPAAISESDLSRAASPAQSTASAPANGATLSRPMSPACLAGERQHGTIAHEGAIDDSLIGALGTYKSNTSERSGGASTPPPPDKYHSDLVHPELLPRAVTPGGTMRMLAQRKSVATPAMGGIATEEDDSDSSNDDFQSIHSDDELATIPSSIPVGQPGAGQDGSLIAWGVIPQETELASPVYPTHAALAASETGSLHDANRSLHSLRHMLHHAASAPQAGAGQKHAPAGTPGEPHTHHHHSFLPKLNVKFPHTHHHHHSHGMSEEGLVTSAHDSPGGNDEENKVKKRRSIRLPRVGTPRAAFARLGLGDDSKRSSMDEAPASGLLYDEDVAPSPTHHHKFNPLRSLSRAGRHSRPHGSATPSNPLPGEDLSGYSSEASSLRDNTSLLEVGSTAPSLKTVGEHADPAVPTGALKVGAEGAVGGGNVGSGATTAPTLVRPKPHVAAPQPLSFGGDDLDDEGSEVVLLEPKDRAQTGDAAIATGAVGAEALAPTVPAVPDPSMSLTPQSSLIPGSTVSPTTNSEQPAQPLPLPQPADHDTSFILEPAPQELVAEMQAQSAGDGLVPTDFRTADTLAVAGARQGPCESTADKGANALVAAETSPEGKPAASGQAAGSTHPTSPAAGRGGAAESGGAPASPHVGGQADTLTPKIAQYVSRLDGELGPWRFAEPGTDVMEDNAFIKLYQSMTTPQRRKYFADATHREEFVYDPDVVYCTTFFTNMFDMNTFDLHIGPVRLNIQRWFTEMPLRYTLRHATNEDITFATISFQIVDR